MMPLRSQVSIANMYSLPLISDSQNIRKAKVPRRKNNIFLEAYLAPRCTVPVLTSMP